MNEQEQRIAIAEACGLYVLESANPDDPEAWKKGYFTPQAAKIRRKNWPNSGAVKIIPDYLNDLNAMHEAEKVLGPEQQWNYGATLANMVLAPERAFFKEPESEPELNSLGFFALANISAAQRAEAFLRTIGRWVEDKDPYYELLAEDYSAVDAP